MARFELEYLGGIQKDVDDSLEDIQRAIAGKGLPKEKKLTQLVESQEKAHLVVEILCRRQKKNNWSLTGRDYVIAIKLSPGKALSSSPFDEIIPESGAGRQVLMVHAFREEEPYWILECVSNDRWSNAANAVAGTVNEFIKDNQKVLLMASQSQ